MMITDRTIDILLHQKNGQRKNFANHAAEILSLPPHSTVVVIKSTRRELDHAREFLLNNVIPYGRVNTIQRHLIKTKDGIAIHFVDGEGEDYQVRGMSLDLVLE